MLAIWSLVPLPFLKRGVSPHCRPSWPWRGIAPLSPPGPAQPPLLGREVAPPTRRRQGGSSSLLPPLASCGCSSSPLLRCHSLAFLAAAPDLGLEVAPPGCRHPWPRREVALPGCCPWPRTQGKSSQLLLRCCSLAFLAAVPDLGRGVAPPGHSPWPQTWGNSSWSPPLCMGSSRLLPLTSDVG